LELSQTTISKWLKQFIEAGREGLDRGENPRKPTSKRECELETQVQELTTALGEAYVELRTWRKGGFPTALHGPRADPHRRKDDDRALLSSSRNPRSTYYYWRNGHLGGHEVKRWPAPVVDEVAQSAAVHAAKFSAWGHRKIWAMLRADGITVSQSSIYRALNVKHYCNPPAITQNGEH